jgi:hypothetical protein
MKQHSYDIVRKEGEKLRWLEDAKDLDSAVSRIRELSSFWPGEFQVMDQQNHRLVAENTDSRTLSLANPERNLEKHRVICKIDAQRVWQHAAPCESMRFGGIKS